MNANKAKHEARVAEWMERVRECRSSGLSVKVWCAEQGVKTATYYRWEREVLTKASGTLAKRGAHQEEAEQKPTFVELPEAGSDKGKARGKGRVVAELETGKGVVRIYEGADAEVVRTLCGAALCRTTSRARRISTSPAAIRTYGGGLTDWRESWSGNFSLTRFRTACFSFAAGERTESRRSTGRATDSSSYISGWNRGAFNGRATRERSKR